MFALDCPNWKEQHGCEDGLTKDLCKKTCEQCGQLHEGLGHSDRVDVDDVQCKILKDGGKL